MDSQQLTLPIPKLLTPHQVADLLGVSIGTLEIWRCTNRYPLPYIKVGRSVRYDPSDVQEFITSRRHQHTGMSA